MPDPLFILAPPRSFTSVVCAMVGQHPQLLGLPEVNLFGGDTYETNRWYASRPHLRHGLLRALAELSLGRQTFGNVKKVEEWLAAYPGMPSGDIFRELVAAAGELRLVDKSPLYVIDEAALPRIRETFPDAYYLHLTRHPRATCESLYKLRQTILQYGGLPSSVDLDPERIWLKPHQRAWAFLETIPQERKLRLRGEDLMAELDTHLVQICHWLGIRDDAAALDAMKHPERSPFACKGPINAMLGNDPGFLEDPVLRPYKPKPMTLEGGLSYDPDLRFSNALKDCAALLGYADEAPASTAA